MRHTWPKAVLVLGLVTGLALVAWPASGQDVTVVSERMQIQERTGEIRFEGSVEVRMSDLVLNCDLLHVNVDETDPSTILSGKASGNVVLTRGGDTIEAQEALFDLEAGTVELTGDPRLSREDTTITAERILYTMEQGTASFSGPVRAFFKAPGD